MTTSSERRAPAAGDDSKTRESTAADLGERADAAVAAVAERARGDIELARQIRDRLIGDFYSLGEVLKRLKDSRAAQALGYRSFAEMCSVELEISGRTAADLIDMVENVGPVFARRFGQSQVLVMVKLCRATPEDDTVEDLVEKGRVPLPSGKDLDVGGSTVREKEDAAKEIRDATPTEGKKKRGTTTSAEDRRVAAEAEAALHAVGLKRAEVRAVARPGKVADSPHRGDSNVRHGAALQGVVRAAPEVTPRISRVRGHLQTPATGLADVCNWTCRRLQLDLQTSATGIADVCNASALRRFC